MQESVRQLIQANLAFLHQGIDLLSGLSSAHYNKTFEPVYTSSIGAHVRHVYDHYRQLLNGLEARLVDYDERVRDPRIESDREYALQCLDQLLAALTVIGNQDVSLDVSLNCGRQNAASCPSKSTLARELQFLVSHTVHHYALIAFILRSEGIETPAGFGVSPSTLAYRARPVKHAG